MRLSLYVKSGPFKGVAGWSGENPWPAVPDVGETLFCCDEMDMGSVRYRQFTWDSGDIEIVIQYEGHDPDWLDLKTHLKDEHGWELT